MSLNPPGTEREPTVIRPDLRAYARNRMSVAAVPLGFIVVAMAARAARLISGGVPLGPILLAVATIELSILAVVIVMFLRALIVITSSEITINNGFRRITVARTQIASVKAVTVAYGSALRREYFLLDSDGDVVTRVLADFWSPRSLARLSVALGFSPPTDWPTISMNDRPHTAVPKTAAR